MKWVDNHIEIEELPKKFKKITGTRFGAVLGLNQWSSPFQAWCEITKTYEKPFEDTIYTIAGKTIESKQAKYLEDRYYCEIKTPTDVYGEDYFKKTYGDFYKDEPIFGGMWDFLNYRDKNLDAIIECKTTKRAEDWNGTIPVYYALQAALYAYLKGCEKVIMICSFLDESDYEHPEDYAPNINNTITKVFRVHEYFPDFDEKLAEARRFWEEHVLTGISPDYDEKVDADYLKELRKNNLNPESDIKALAEEYEKLAEEIKENDLQMQVKTKRLDIIKGLLKGYLSENLRDGDVKSSFQGTKYEFVVMKTQSTSIDKDLLKKDGLLPRYEVKSTTLKFTTKEIKEDKVNE